MIKKTWTGYAALLTAVVIVGEVANLMHGGALDFRTMANWIVTGVLLLATWGYALQKPIGGQYYWRTACWVVIGATLIAVVPAAFAGPEAIIMVLFLLVLVVPANFSLVLTTVDRCNEHIEVMKGEEQGGVAHHIYWLTAAEMGYVGLIASLVVLGGVLWRAGLGAVRAAGVDSLLLWGFFIGFVALYLQGTLEWGVRITPMAFQLTICGALTVALSANPRARRLAT